MLPDSLPQNGSAAITPAELCFREDGTPWSATFGDVYHSRHGALGQIHHVFLAGNGLPARWRGKDRFVILETGFGLGLNFLATWAAWAADPERSRELHFISVELHPFQREGLGRLHQDYPELAPYAAALQAAWPPLVAGPHRLHFHDGQVCLTLHFGDARQCLPNLGILADALYLDGFSPARNPELWSPPIFQALSRLAAPEATLATWSVAGAVRQGLTGAGFDLTRAPGYQGKREMLVGRFRHRRPDRRPHHPERRALVLGAGFAGTSVAERLAARGWRVRVYDEGGPGAGASGNRVGIFRPQPSADDNRLSQLLRSAFLYTRRHLEALATRGLPVRFSLGGVLHLAEDAGEEALMARTIAANGLPESFQQYLPATAAGALIGWPIERGGWWFPQAGWGVPPSLCEANLAAGKDRISTAFGPGARITGFRATAGGWALLGPDGQVLDEAPILILANGTGSRPLIEGSLHTRWLPLRPARGQTTHLPEGLLPALDTVICGGSYLTPAVEGVQVCGASFLVDDEDSTLRPGEHRENLEKLAARLPGYLGPLDPGRFAATAPGRVGFRPVAPDRLPLIGQIPVWQGDAPTTSPGALHALPRHPGLFLINGFGARGFVWSALAGELLTSQICGDPLPLCRDQVDALDPARFLVRPVSWMQNPQTEADT